MKLAHYTIRNLSIPLLLIMTIWAGVFYFLVLHEVNDETNDTLQNYKEMIIKHALSDSTFLENDEKNMMNSYYIHEISKEEANLMKEEFYDATKYVEIEREHEPIRVLRTCFMTSNGKYYELKIEISTLEKEDLLETVLWSIIALYLLLLCCILVVTHYVFHKSFRPLYTILNWLKYYIPGKKAEPLRNETTVDEFDALNKAFEEATQRGNVLFDQQKQFVENASHELQTPLAVSMNKLELLSENSDCTEEQLREISDVYQTLQGVVRMNKSLLLISRIDNNQYLETQDVSITELVKVLLAEYEEIYAGKHIRTFLIKEDELVRNMNESLANTLVKNILRNAFIHNIPEGEIYIEITSNTLSIENTSDSPELNQDKLFSRFARQSNRPDSTGLGLAIVKSIAKIYHIEVAYFYNGKHRFVLTF